MKPPFTVTLAGADYTIQPLTLGDIEDLAEIIMPTAAGAETPRAKPFARNIDVLARALRANHPTMTTEALRGMHISTAEMKAATDAVLRHSELIPKGEAQAPVDGA